MKKYISILLVLVIISALFTQFTVSACYNNPPSSNCAVPNYTHGVEIGSGQASETFHPSANIEETKWSNLSILYQMASYVFNTGSNINFNYYLWGEYDIGIGTHEGVDMRHTTQKNRMIFCPITGTVVRKNQGYGEVSIYSSHLNKTITFMHMQDLSPNLKVGQTVSRASYLGYQSNVGVNRAYEKSGYEHLHIEVKNGNNTTVANGKDDTLTTPSPYSALLWAVNSYK